jgi:hypothetical protein
MGRLLNRRQFLTASTTAITATLSPRPGLFAQLEKLPSSLPDSSLYTHNEGAYWGELRKRDWVAEREEFSQGKPS